MSRYVIGHDVALRLAGSGAEVAGEHQLLAPTLQRSQILAFLYEAVRRGDLDRKEADARLAYIRGLKVRLLGDRTLQRVAWKIAEALEWPDTYEAEYLALTQLQADAFITLDQGLAEAARQAVSVAPIEVLFE